VALSRRTERFGLLRALEIAFGIILAFLALGLAASLLDARSLAYDVSEVESTQRTLAHLDDLAERVERIVTMARMFILTGVENFVAPFEETYRQLEADDWALQHDFASDPDQSVRIEALGHLIENRVALSRNYIALRRTNDLTQTVAAIPPGGERLATEIRARIAQLKDAARRRLEDQQAASAASHAAGRRAIAFAAAVSALLLVLAFLLFRQHARSRKALQHEVLTAGDEERSRVGHDLHDGLGQELTVISFGLAALARTLENEDSAHAKRVHELRVLAQRSAVDAGSIARSLSPPVGAEHGLRRVLMTLADEVSQLAGVNCSAHVSPKHDLRDAAVVGQLFRIAQEAIANALKHGKARNVGLFFKQVDEQAWLAIVDDGIGFGRESVQSDEGLGLKSMRRRAEALGGTLLVRCRTKGGTEVRCTFPVPAVSRDAAVTPRKPRSAMPRNPLATLGSLPSRRSG
jgi:signal transduction histidine kinase